MSALTYFQKGKLRDVVRVRDKCCQVTGTNYIKRKRGSDFTGLEVAHIYPFNMATKVCFTITVMSID